MREIGYGRVVHELHQKFFARLSLLLSVLGIAGVSAPLVVALGGEHAVFAIVAAVLFVAIQAIDWKLAPGERAGLFSAKAREFHRLSSAARKLTTDELDVRKFDLQDNELTEIGALRRIAFIEAAREGGYLQLLPQEQLVLSQWARILHVFVF